MSMRTHVARPYCSCRTFVAHRERQLAAEVSRLSYAVAALTAEREGLAAAAGVRVNGPYSVHGQQPKG